MPGVSRRVVSNQTAIHENLEVLVRRHMSHVFQRPFADHSLTAFKAVEATLAGDTRPLILDSCCGVGDSSRALASACPDHLVVAVDRSLNRLSKQRDAGTPDNLIFVRADLMDFYRLAADAGWQPSRHYILYPNPYPKSAQVGRRWHGSPVFPDIVRLGGLLEVRSNWRLYLDECAVALEMFGVEASIEPLLVRQPLTAFEKKYHQSGQPLWRLQADLTPETVSGG